MMRFIFKAVQYVINVVGAFTAIVIVMDITSKIGIMDVSMYTLGALLTIGMMTFRA